MKVLTIPRSGKIRDRVAYSSRFGECERALVQPRNISSPARDFMHAVFGCYSQAWGRRLTQDQRDRWNYAGPKVMSHSRLGKGPLSGAQHFEAVNCIRARVGLDPV